MKARAVGGCLILINENYEFDAADFLLEERATARILGGAGVVIGASWRV